MVNEQTLEKHLVDVLTFTLQNKGTLVDIARNLGMRIVDIIPYIKEIADENPKLAEYISRHKWPIDVNVGYIYMGGVPLLSPHGERSGLLSPGMHVLAKKLPRKNKAQKYEYYTIYWPAKLTYFKYKKFKIITDESGETIGGEYLTDNHNNVKCEWLSNETDNNTRLIELSRMGIYLEKTEVCKEEWIYDKEIGIVNETMIVSVNYDWT